jgi:hypothetical protein
VTVNLQLVSFSNRLAPFSGRVPDAAATTKIFGRQLHTYLFFNFPQFNVIMKKENDEVHKEYIPLIAIHGRKVGSNPIETGDIILILEV